MSSWLQKQRKADLADLADKAGLRGTSQMLKEELTASLDEFLRKNETRLASNSAFSDYYRRGASPAKKEPLVSVTSVTSDSDSKPAPKPRQRRTTKASTDFEGDTSPLSSASNALATRTPRALQAGAARMPLPPSPSAVTDMVERQTARLTTTMSRYFGATGLDTYTNELRATLSSVAAIQAGVLALEAAGLQRATLPWKYVGALPAVPGAAALGLTRTMHGSTFVPVLFPDFFALLTGGFWAPSALWVLVSLVLPLMAGWLVNFTVVAARGARRADKLYQVDPFVFSVAKALVAYAVFANGYRFQGVVSHGTVAVVETAVYGGWPGMVIGGGVGALASLYEAALRK